MADVNERSPLLYFNGRHMGFQALVLFLISSGLLLPGITLSSETTEPQPPSPGSWEKARDFAGDLWQKTQDMADQTWRDTQEYFGASRDDDSFARVWGDILPRLEEARELADEHASLPDKAWFERDQRDNTEDINELLDQSVEILSISTSQRYRENIRVLETKIQRAQEQIAEYRKERVAAPQGGLLQKTVQDYDEAIAEKMAIIVEYRRQLQQIKSDFAQELRAQGLEISDEQLDFLLSTVIGDDLLTMSVAFDNAKAITTQLEQLMVSSQEDLTSARRYYGMYTILLKVLVRMHQHVIDAVKQRYLAQIDTIVNRTKALLNETRRLEKRSPANREVLAANIRSQELTLRAAGFYRDYLLEQSREIAKAREQIKQDLAIAENTYETVKVSGELVDLMRSSQRLLATLVDRQVPALRAFENLEMRREFEKLTVQLREGVE